MRTAQLAVEARVGRLGLAVAALPRCLTPHEALSPPRPLARLEQQSKQRCDRLRVRAFRPRSPVVHVQEAQTRRTRVDGCCSELLSASPPPPLGRRVRKQRVTEGSAVPLAGAGSSGR